jgi:hypothetical protein
MISQFLSLRCGYIRHKCHKRLNEEHRLFSENLIYFKTKKIKVSSGIKLSFSLISNNSSEHDLFLIILSLILKLSEENSMNLSDYVHFQS